VKHLVVKKESVTVDRLESLEKQMKRLADLMEGERQLDPLNLSSGDKVGQGGTSLEDLASWRINKKPRLDPYLFSGSFLQEADKARFLYRPYVPIGATGNIAAVFANASDGTPNTENPLLVESWSMRYNNLTWDRYYNNHNVTILSSALRTTTQNTEFTNFNFSKCILVLDVTVAPSVETLTLKLEMKDGIAGDFIEMAVTTADADAGKHVIIVDPSGGADTFTDAGSEIQQQLRIDLPLPRDLRATITHSASGNWTYSVSCSYMV